MIETNLDGKTPDIADENIEKLKELFPDVFAEGKIDFEKLKQVLGENVETNEERYNFSWSGKAKALRLAQTPSMGTLRPCKEESKDWDTTENLYIEGDNLEVLKLLQKSYHNKVKMIYIDPPYNTGKDFVYRDNFRNNIENYKNITGQIDMEGKKLSSNSETSGRYHTDWLNMMYPRLRLARNLLKDSGIIFISIDDNEVDNLKKICNEIFGEDNFVGSITWQTATDNNPSQISIEHEYILCFAKSLITQDKWLIKSDKAERISEKYRELNKVHEGNIEAIQIELRNWMKVNEKDFKGVAHYTYVDNKGVYYPGNSSNTKSGGYTFDIIHPITNKICNKPDFGYRWREDTFLEASKRGDVQWGNDENTIPKIKKRIETVSEMLKSYYYEDNRYWTKYLRNLIGKGVFENPKSVTLLCKLMKFTTYENDIIMDIFSGSATTAQAVMKVNIEDDSKRKFIMVQLPELIDKKHEAYKQGYETIAEIGKERIRRAGDKIVEENKDKENIENLDIGFKVLKLDTSNIRKWQPDQDNIESSLLDYIENYVEGRTELDVVYEIMIKYGLNLTYNIDEHMVDGKRVYSIGCGLLMICLDDNLNTEVAKGILELVKQLEPESTRIVFKDNGFKSDSNKTNIKEILKCGGIEEFITI